MRRYLCFLLITLAGLPMTGCRWAWLQRPVPEPTPVVFPSPPMMEQVIGYVNANSSRVRQLQSESATLRMRGFPALRANLAFEQTRRFRLRSDILGLPGTGIDLGSNDELFWVWIEQSQPRAVHYARHDEYAVSPAREMFPIDPVQLVEALGVVTFDSASIHKGPFRNQPGRMEIRSTIPSHRGDMTKVTVLHERFGWVLEQHLYDSGGRLLASARASDHRHYPAQGVTLPHHVEVQLAAGQPTEMSFTIDIRNYLVNQLSGDPNQLWAIPQPAGVPLVNIAGPGFQPATAGTRIPVGPQAAYSPDADPSAAYRSRIRGMYR